MGEEDSYLENDPPNPLSRTEGQNWKVNAERWRTS
jgi:hypothetical protein